MCNCEHTSHFNDQFGPQTNHDYATVRAGEKKALFVGKVCDDCANTCMKEYIQN